MEEITLQEQKDILKQKVRKDLLMSHNEGFKK